MHVSKKTTVKFKSAVPKSMHFTYLRNIDIVIFCRYHIDIVSNLKSDNEAPLMHCGRIRATLIAFAIFGF